MRLVLGLGILAGLLAPAAIGAEEADAWSKKLSPGIVARLDRDGLVVIDTPLKQIFTPYIGSALPVFVTSDTVLNAYHVLLEESVIRLETERARRLPGFLLRTWSGLVKPRNSIRLDAKMVEGATRRARVTIATAIRLLGAEVPAGDDEARRLATAEAARVEAASWHGKPAWLGPPDPGFLGFDYARFRPRGFYDREEGLRRYFRAVAWLQAVPFRVDRDEEFLAAVLLRGSVDLDSQEGEDRRFVRGYVNLLGAGDDLSLFEVSETDWDEFDRDDLADLRRWSGKGDYSVVNDVESWPDGAGRSIRFLPAARTPDAVLFARTAAGPPPGRSMPVGLEVTAALGHAWSRDRLADPALVKIVDETRSAFDVDGLVARYHRMIGALLDPPEPDAPDLFRGDAWQAKAAQTALAGWALQRHTWALQAKISAAYLGVAETPPGFVEPDPEFFGRMRGLARRTRDLLGAGGAFDAASLRGEAAEAVTVLLRILDGQTIDADWRIWKLYESLGERDRRAVSLAATVAAHRRLPHLGDLDAESVKRLCAGLRAIRAILADPGRPLPPDLQEMIRDSLERLRGPWRSLETLCGRLETLAHKQLRGVPFREDEGRFLEGFGEVLAGIMLHGGNSWLEPKDDAPRITTVHRDPNTDRWLQVGVARPRPILVLYPTKGGSVLCGGAVLAYREFAWSGPLTDAEWLTLLDEKKAPDGPAWRKAIEMAPPAAPPREK